MKLTTLGFGALTGALALCLSLAGAEAQPPAGTVSGVTGVKQDAIEKVKPIVPPNAPPPPPTAPPPNSSTAQPVKKVDGIHTIDGVKTTGQAPPPPPPPPPPAAVSSVTNAGATAAGSIHAVHGVGGLNAVKLQNLETALKIKQASGGTPIGTGAENGGKGKAAAAALLAKPLDQAPPKTGPKEDGRAGFQEFEKLQNRGS
jgi:hypothetical protein